MLTCTKVEILPASCDSLVPLALISPRSNKTAEMLTCDDSQGTHDVSDAKGNRNCLCRCRMMRSRCECRGIKRLVESLIIAPAIYLAMHQYPPARPLALIALGRTRGCALARAMEGDRDVRRRIALRRIQMPKLGFDT